MAEIQQQSQLVVRPLVDFRVGRNGHVGFGEAALKVLQIMSVKGGVGKVIEYCGEGVKSLSVPERATITNMGAEMCIRDR